MWSWATDNMASRRDLLLQQLGITQWTLRRPTVLQGEIAVTLPTGTRLVIVAAQPPKLNDPLINDVLRSLSLQPEQVYTLTPEQVAMLPASTHCHSWRLGGDTALPLLGVQLVSPSLSELYGNVQAKRALWQQMGSQLAQLSPADAAPTDADDSAD